MLLVTAVLAGLLGMHGLAPGVAPAPQAGAGHGMAAAHDGATAAVDGVPHAAGECAHTDGGPGRPHHADGTCAAAGIGSAYTPPATRPPCFLWAVTAL
ncbi:hypothetical protein SUDANB6_02577 [Streptomyces sp. enrichment culture]|uniref:DUF6153 family protein n=1 Tax=Streptomyces sp. enrichment culture TaxID=1795815 RepID=UPI003F55F501